MGQAARFKNQKQHQHQAEEDRPERSQETGGLGREQSGHRAPAIPGQVFQQNYCRNPQEGTEIGAQPADDQHAQQDDRLLQIVAELGTDAALAMGFERAGNPGQERGDEEGLSICIGTD
jgi:hypothetical protein